MTSFALKVIACITMFIDHLSYGLYGEMSWMNYIGRIAFPIFAFQITEGYRHTKDIKKYFIRLIIFAFISQIPFHLFHSIISDTYGLNVLFTLCLGLFCIWIWEKLQNETFNKFLAIIIITFVCIIAELTNMDYGYWGVLLVFVFYMCKENKIAIGLAFVGMVLLKYARLFVLYSFYYKYILLFIGTLAALIPILLYNGKQGKKIKYFLYIFYPVHILLLVGLHSLLF